MRADSLSWVAAIVLAAGCGGASFTPIDTSTGDGGGSSDGSTSGDGGGGDGGGTGSGSGGASSSGTSGGGSGGSSSGATGGTQCGPSLTCSGTNGQQGTICCVGQGTPPQYSCAAQTCGCDTQLECASSADCGGATPVCCIEQRQDATCAQHYVARCATSCSNGALELCNPLAPSCTSGSCQPDVGCVNLPSQQGFGICGGC